MLDYLSYIANLVCSAFVRLDTDLSEFCNTLNNLHFAKLAIMVKRNSPKIGLPNCPLLGSLSPLKTQ